MSHRTHICFRPAQGRTKIICAPCDKLDVNESVNEAGEHAYWVAWHHPEKRMNFRIDNDEARMLIYELTGDDVYKPRPSQADRLEGAEPEEDMPFE